MNSRFLFPAFCALMLLIPALPVSDFWITQLNYIGIYAMVSLGLVLRRGALSEFWPWLANLNPFLRNKFRCDSNIATTCRPINSHALTQLAGTRFAK